jgi:hypothetical protein
MYLMIPIILQILNMNRIYTFDKNTKKFTYRIDNFDKITTDSFFDAVDKTVKDIKKEMTTLGLDKIGLCLSGIDSELIAHYIHLNDIPVEYFFFHINGINDSTKIIVEEIAKKYDVKLNIYKFTVDEILKSIIHENFEIAEVCWPTYSTVPYILKLIPNDFYVIVGEGDLEKDSVNKYLTIFNRKIVNYDSNMFYIPMHLTEIAYQQSLNFYKKSGEMNFYSRIFDSWYHILNSNKLRTNGKFFYDPKSILLADLVKMNFVSPLKTLNFENTELVNKIIDILKNKGSANWDPYIGDVVLVPKNLIY